MTLIVQPGFGGRIPLIHLPNCSFNMFIPAWRDSAAGLELIMQNLILKGKSAFSA
jgi:hypothetical protein